MNIGEKLNSDLMLIFEKIFKSDNLLKLIAYNEKDYDTKSIPSTDDLLYVQVLPFRFVPDELEENRTFVNFIFRSFESPQGARYKEGWIEFHIYVHKDNVVTANGLRPLLIFGEIDEMFNRQKFNGLGEIIFDQFDEFQSALRSHYTHHVIRYIIAYEGA